MHAPLIARRRFFGNTTTALLGAAAIPQLPPSRLCGAEASAQMLSVVYIGIGGQIHALIKETAGLPLHVVALCDQPRETQTTQLAGCKGGPRPGSRVERAGWWRGCVSRQDRLRFTAPVVPTGQTAPFLSARR